MRQALASHVPADRRPAGSMEVVMSVARVIATVLFLLTGTVLGRAATPASCTTGTVRQLTISPQREHLRFRGAFAPPAGFDPFDAGLGITIGYAGDPQPFYTATIPSTLFVRTLHSLRFKDHTGVVAGLALVSLSEIQGSPGMMKIRLNRRGTPITGTSMSGPVCVVLSSGGSCVQSCTVCADTGRFRCQATTTARF
jgi:hypothetical protein